MYAGKTIPKIRIGTWPAEKAITKKEKPLIQQIGEALNQAAKRKNGGVYLKYPTRKKAFYAANNWRNLFAARGVRIESRLEGKVVCLRLKPNGKPHAQLR